jgi:DNA-binding NarL/FixJ family response regulator
MQGIRLLLADDHVMVAEGLSFIVKQAFHLVGVVNDGRSMLEAVRNLRPDVIVADISMPVLNGLDALRELRSRGFTTKVIILTMHNDAALAREAFRAGASGYLLKSSAGEELIGAVNEVYAGRVYITPLIAKDLIVGLLNGNETSAVSLTQRQRQVLQLIAEGKTMKEVATVLSISVRTAESHKYDMMHALGIESTAQLIQYGLREHIVIPMASCEKMP